MKLLRSLFGTMMLLCMSLAQHASAQSRPSQPADYTAAEKRHSDLLAFSMHDLPMRADGTKGYETGLPVPEGDFGPIPPFLDRREQRLHLAFCSASDAVVLARMEGSVSALSSGERTIFTRNEFTVQSIITQSPQKALNLTAGKTIYTVNLGGTVIENGDTLKVSVRGAVTYKAGTVYLLLLQHPPSAPADVFSGPEAMNIPVIAGRIYPSPLGYLIGTRGEPLSQVKERFKQSLLRGGCY